MVSLLRPNFQLQLPNRRRLSGQMLESLFKEVEAYVNSRLDSAKEKGGVLSLDGWENVCHEHIVNFLMMLPDASSVFLDSVCTGFESQTATNQARDVMRVIERCGGTTVVAAVASDNTKACVNMREQVSRELPGVCSLNDMAHLGNLVTKDLASIPSLREYLDSVTFVATYVREHSKLLNFYGQRAK